MVVPLCASFFFLLTRGMMGVEGETWWARLSTTRERQCALHESQTSNHLVLRWHLTQDNICMIKVWCANMATGCKSISSPYGCLLWLSSHQLTTSFFCWYWRHKRSTGKINFSSCCCYKQWGMGRLLLVVHWQATCWSASFFICWY